MFKQIPKSQNLHQFHHIQFHPQYKKINPVKFKETLTKLKHKLTLKL